MKYFVYCLLVLAPFSYGNNVQNSDENQNQQAEEYCHSMLQDGTSDEEATEYVNQCMAEQKSYMEEQDEASKPDCYQQVDEVIQQKLDQDRNSDYDYDGLLDECFKNSEQ